MRRDLGESLHLLTRALLAAEEPVLDAAGIGMWEYVVLSALGRGPAPTQAGLAAAVGRDKTRLIGLLDGLEARGLLRRTPDPADRRNRVVTLTAAGRDLLERCRTGIHEVEDEVLAPLDTDRRAMFVAALDRLADAVDPR